MADPAKRRQENEPGRFFVDETCIDCDTCRWMLPSVYDRVNGKSAVVRQPEGDDEELAALKAVVACPTASIGTQLTHPRAKEAVVAFPDPIDNNVYHMGFHSPDSFGATSYLLVREGGNVLMDSPRYNEALAKRVEALGEVKTMYLTHRDDVADHARWAKRLGCQRVLHRDDVGRDTKDVEVQPEGEEEVRLDDDLLVIPVPGHTKGHTVLLAGEYLFTGDHLAYSPKRDALVAFRGACWYDWGEQTRSMKRLLDHSFSWVLPGHGRRHHAPPQEMHEKLTVLLNWMKEHA